MKKSKEKLHDLTWADLEAWAETKIVSRGTSYQKSGYVRELAVTRTGGILAWVRGTKNYATKVAFEKGRLVIPPLSACLTLWVLGGNISLNSGQPEWRSL